MYLDDDKLFWEVCIVCWLTCLCLLGFDVWVTDTWRILIAAIPLGIVSFVGLRISILERKACKAEGKTGS